MQLAVDIELGLVPCAVADPHRATPAVAGQVRELVLGDEALAADPVHDLQALPEGKASGGRRWRRSRKNPVGLEAAPAGRERADREARVAHPRVAVVPVPDPADLLGQRGGGRGDDGARRCVVQRTQHDRAPAQRSRFSPSYPMSFSPTIASRRSSRRALNTTSRASARGDLVPGIARPTTRTPGTRPAPTVSVRATPHRRRGAARRKQWSR